MPNGFQASGLAIYLLTIAAVASIFARPLNEYFWLNAIAYFLVQFLPAVFSGALVVKHLVLRQYWSWVAASYAVTFVFVLRAVDELYLYKGSNSMPYFVYIFFCIPLTLLGIFLGSWLGDRWLNKRAIPKALLVFFSGISLGLIFSWKNLMLGLWSVLQH